MQSFLSTFCKCSACVYFLILTLLITSNEMLGQNQRLSFDSDGFPIYSTSLIYAQYPFTTKHGETLGAYTLVDRHWTKPVIARLNISKYYFEAVPESKEVVQNSLRQHRRLGWLGYGSLLGGFTLAGASYGISAKFGDATAPIYFGVGFLSGVYFLFRRAVVDKRNFDRCIQTFNEHQSKYLVSAKESEWLNFDKFIHLKRIYKGVAYSQGNFNSSTTNRYITGEKLTGFSIGANGDVSKFKLGTLKAPLQTTAESARLWKKANGRYVLKKIGMLTTIFGSFVISEIAGNGEPVMAITASTVYAAGIVALFLRSHKKILKDAVRAYNIQQIYTDYYSQDVSQSKFKLSGLAYQPLNLAGARANVLSLQFQF